MLAFAAGLLALSAIAAEGAKPHRVAFHVDQNDADVMNLVLNNAKNVIEYYRDKNEDVEIEIVTYSGGLHMLRSDTSPVKDRIREMSASSKIVFSACDKTKKGMEKREGRPVPLVAQASIVPSGVVRLIQLQEEGWSYVRP
jgi:hypothetical protein